MRKDLPAKLLVESGLAVLSTAILVLTVVWRDWIEGLLGVGPDGGGGSFEWMLTAGALAASAWSWWLVRSAWSELAGTEQA